MKILVKEFEGTFEKCQQKSGEDSFIYFDPPYRPISQTSNFTSYSKYEFCDERQIQLGRFYQKIDKEKQSKLMLSNSDPKNLNQADNFFEKLYSNYKISRVAATRMINSNARKRGQIYELVITNY